MLTKQIFTQTWQKFSRNFRYGYFPKYLQNFYWRKVEDDNSFDSFEIQWSKYYLEDYWLKDSANCKVQWLHNMNNVRVPCVYETYFIPNCLNDYNALEPKEEFKKIKLLDVGCGGGISSEPFAELNFDVTGIDPNPDMIVIAKDHAKRSPFLRGKRIRYYNTTIEDFYKNNLNKFDALLITEVLERIPHNRKRKFLEKCVSCVKPNGDIFITTRNRTYESAKAIFEFIISNRVETGHHSWSKGISHYLLESHLKACGCTMKRLRGFRYEGLDRGFHFTEHFEDWYFVHAIRNRLILTS